MSDIFTVVINPLPNPALSNGNKTLSSNQNTILSVTTHHNESVNWYDTPTNGNLLQSNSVLYTTITTGTLYTEAYNLITGCISLIRTALTVLSLTTASYNVKKLYCSTETTTISLSSLDANAIPTWTATSSNVTGFSNGTGITITQTPIYSGNNSGIVNYTIKPSINGYEGASETIIITVNPQINIIPTFSAIQRTYFINATATNLPTTSSNTIPINGTWNPSSIDISIAGTITHIFTLQQGTNCENIQYYSITITITNGFDPVFDQSISFYAGINAPIFSTLSLNGISDSWFPLTINNQIYGMYTFTPNADQFAISQTIKCNHFYNQH